MFAGHLVVLAVIWTVARIPSAVDPPALRDRAAVRRAGGAAAVHRAPADDRLARLRSLRTRPARLLEHPGKGHAGGADLADAGRHHPAARPAARPATAARPGPGRHDRDADAALRRPDRRRGPAHAAGPPRPRSRPPVPVAGRRHRARRRRAVPAHLRARRARAPGDAVARLHRRDAPDRRRRTRAAGSGSPASPPSRPRHCWRRPAGTSHDRSPSRRARRVRPRRTDATVAGRGRVDVRLPGRPQGPARRRPARRAR